jgi:hypothetical protein
MNLNNFRKSLFWDVDQNALELKENAQFIVGRVLDFWNIKEYLAIKKIYGLDRIKDLARHHVFSDKKSLNFWSIILKIPLKDLKCTKNSSRQTPSAFLRR